MNAKKSKIPPYVLFGSALVGLLAMLYYAINGMDNIASSEENAKTEIENFAKMDTATSESMHLLFSDSLNDDSLIYFKLISN